LFLPLLTLSHVKQLLPRSDAACLGAQVMLQSVRDLLLLGRQLPLVLAADCHQFPPLQQQ